MLWEQKVLNWRDLEIIKGAGLVLRPTSVHSLLASLYFNIRCWITDRCQMKWFFNSVYIEFPSALGEKSFIHGEISIHSKQGFHFHRHRSSQSHLLVGKRMVECCNIFPEDIFMFDYTFTDKIIYFLPQWGHWCTANPNP